ncbi:3-oxoacyl-ACP synthase III [Cryobacterium sp. TMS1-20-1]|uniref:3-oxoacyl-ACP synthase III n=1 Tax=Cryobacterium levicorallinum TaxID=995038 RepID=A0A1I3DVS9_9MICO|nr:MULTISPECIES: 3-oxoacyl-ACP synthase III [Cryobacterium]TFB83951.1 3-oxoacyl-ACP synthase III [Cryobacterium levicorallinum]TFC77607.1 3-oxoacyl-ACP synthase III [Cryobacterium sp. TMS1-20-1]TFD63311.1 3-oxoacyl-ACP synthase III [Cryobacterium sp. Hh38]SFH90669.1 3-oxoacyl-[acyl-carrier-protein] synthase-3 [Cryobacterium levicorallinum]
MNGNATTTHRNVALLSVASLMAPLITTSEEIDRRLKPVLTRLKLPTGLLQRVAGVYERRNWGPDETFDDAAVKAGKIALKEAGIKPSDVGLLINTSVTRKHLEPSVAVRIHHGLGLPSSAINFDIANACLGFVNGMTLAAQLIDSGQIKYAVIIDGEDADEIQTNTIDRLGRPGIKRKDFMSEFASLTLGSGAAAAVLGPADAHPAGHRILGGVTRAATQFNGLCVGSVDGMFTDAKALLKGGMELVVSAWTEAKRDWSWSNMDRYIVHQVSDVHTNAIVKATGMDKTKVPLTYPKLGNVGPASIPITLSQEASKLQPGNRVLLMGVGSGLNTAMMELVW